MSVAGIEQLLLDFASSFGYGRQLRPSAGHYIRGSGPFGLNSQHLTSISSGGRYFGTIDNGQNEADCTKVDRRKGAKEAAGDQGGAQECTGDGRSEEAPSLQARHGGAARDPSLPEEH